MDIEYRDIVGFEGYRVGSDGSVWSCRAKGRRYKHSQSRPLISEWKRMKTPVLVSGYLSVALRNTAGKVITMHVHRLVLEAFVGPCPNGMEACHYPDKTRTNCSIDNLRWDTRSANAKDCVIHSTMQPGYVHHSAKLSIDIVHNARLRYAQGGISLSKLSAEYGVNRATLGEAIRKKTWKHVA